jgi:hypothetical protein
VKGCARNWCNRPRQPVRSAPFRMSDGCTSHFAPGNSWCCTQAVAATQSVCICLLRPAMESSRAFSFELGQACNRSLQLHRFSSQSSLGCQCPIRIRPIYVRESTYIQQIVCFLQTAAPGMAVHS